MKLTFQKLSEWTKGVWHNVSNLSAEVDGFSNDTRQIRPGQCFLAIKSGKNDGHDYLYTAQQKGASAAIVERVDSTIFLPQLQVTHVLNAFHVVAKNFRKWLPIPVVGLTGSLGKTTTKDLLAILLGEAVTGKTMGNFNNYLGVPLTLTQLDPQKHSYAVVELGVSESNEMEPLAKIAEPDLAIVLNVEPVHLGNFDNSLEAIAKEKCELFNYLRPNGKIFFFANLLRYDCFKRFSEKAFILADIEEKLDRFYPNTIAYAATCLKPGLWELKISGKEFQHAFSLPFFIGKGLISNFAMALTVATVMGVEKSILQDRLLTWKPSAKRGEWLSIGNQKFFVDCYNANPISMLESIQIFQMQAPSTLPHLYVIGQIAELGRASENYHFEMGAQIKIRPQDSVILVGENMQPVYEGLLKAGNKAHQITKVPSTEAMGTSIQNFQGAVFLKGSRYHRLERLTDPERLV